MATKKTPTRRPRAKALAPPSRPATKKPAAPSSRPAARKAAKKGAAPPAAKRSAKKGAPQAAAAASASAKPLSVQRARTLALASVAPAPLPARLADASPAALAEERRQLELRRKKVRQQKILVYEEALARMAPTTSTVGFAAAAAPARPLRLLAEGDSWFDYPNVRGAGVIFQLEQMINLPILNLAKAGDEVRYMLGVAERQELAKLIESNAKKGTPFDALFFSGGGNDFVGDQLCLWLKPFLPGMTASDVVDPVRFGSLMTLVRGGYEDLITVRDQVSPTTALFFHGYDFAIPSGKGICSFGPWLRPSLDFRGVPRPLQRDVVKDLLLRFQDVINGLASPDRRVFSIPTQGTFKGHDDFWDNELHPNRDGFVAVAKKFRAALKAVFPTVK